MKIKYSGSANDAEREEVEEVIQQLSNMRRKIGDMQAKQLFLESLLIKIRYSLPLTRASADFLTTDLGWNSWHQNLFILRWTGSRRKTSRWWWCRKSI
mmetsp:Transcript_11535/g.39786  ORF Transcript_11535/g.39786 Transcript_11535/m.39786 type:complete len:98 (+) Transcript_11535:1701-1994(+)